MRKLKLPEHPVFFERYGYFRDYGDGTMLVYWTGSLLEYVLFTPFGSPKKEIINKELLDNYKKELFGQ